MNVSEKTKKIWTIVITAFLASLITYLLTGV